MDYVPHVLYKVPNASGAMDAPQSTPTPLLTKLHFPSYCRAWRLAIASHLNIETSEFSKHNGNINNNEDISNGQELNITLYAVTCICRISVEKLKSPQQQNAILPPKA